MINTPKRRYDIAALALSAAYAAFLLTAVYTFKHRLVDGPFAWLMAILPALPILGIFAAIGRYLVEESDEYLRMIMIRQTLWASGFALSIATVWGFFESFEMVGHVQSYAVAVLWFGGLGLGRLVNRFTYEQAA